MDNLSNIIGKVQNFKFIMVTSATNQKRTIKYRGKFTRSVWCSFHDRVTDLNGGRSSLSVLLVKHLLPRGFTLLPYRLWNDLEAVKLQFRIVV